MYSVESAVCAGFDARIARTMDAGVFVREDDRVTFFYVGDHDDIDRAGHHTGVAAGTTVSECFVLRMRPWGSFPRFRIASTFL